MLNTSHSGLFFLQGQRRLTSVNEARVFIQCFTCFQVYWSPNRSLLDSVVCNRLSKRQKHRVVWNEARITDDMSRWGKKIVSILWHCSTVILERRPFPFSALKNGGKYRLGSELRRAHFQIEELLRRYFNTVWDENLPSLRYNKHKTKAQFRLGYISAYFVLMFFLILF